MTEQYNTKTRIGKYEIGEWVSIKKQVRASKLDSKQIGPYKIIGFDKERRTNVLLQFCGLEGTELTQHQNNLQPWPALTDLDVKAEGFPMMEWKEPHFKNTIRLKNAVDEIRKHYNLNRNEPILMKHLIGKEILVKWPQFKGEEHRGTIIAHEGNGNFFVDYPQLTNEEGDHTFPEKLLGRRAPQWRFPKKRQ